MVSRIMVPELPAQPLELLGKACSGPQSVGPRLLAQKVAEAADKKTETHELTQSGKSFQTYAGMMTVPCHHRPCIPGECDAARKCRLSSGAIGQ